MDFDDDTLMIPENMRNLAVVLQNCKLFLRQFGDVYEACKSIIYKIVALLCLSKT